MPSQEINRRLWSNYDWREGGEEWSSNWGGTFNLWHVTLMPRLGLFAKDTRALEIGPGHGRLTAYLKDCCSSLVLVDLAPNCIEFCRTRFVDDRHIEYLVNDGASFPGIEAASIDLVFSFDSLVHSDMQAIRGYLCEIERVLKPGGRAFLHHSNLASVLEDGAGLKAPGSFHLRARDVSADRVLAFARSLETLECCVQERISWDESERLIDCISTFRRCEERTLAPVRQFTNPDFYRDALGIRRVSEFYFPDRGAADRQR